VAHFGDDDGGRLFDPQRNQARHLTDPLSTGAVIFCRSDWKSCVGGLTEETLWLLGSSAAAEFDSLADDLPQLSSRAFPASGVYHLASDGLRLTADAGPFGAGHCGHAHADALALTVVADGHEWLADRGTFTYTGSDAWRELYRGTAAHNTVRIDSRDQAEPVAPFKWEKIPQVRAEHWWSGEHFDLLVASHTGYERLTSPATHRRWVFFVKPRFWLVVDTVEGVGDHQLEVFWQLSCSTASLTSTSLEMTTEVGERFAIIPLSDSAWSRELVESWHSAAYGQSEAASTLRCSIRTGLPTHFATLLLPRATENPGRLERFGGAPNAGEMAYGFRYVDGCEQHTWVLAPGHNSWRIGDFESDARFVYCQQKSSGQPSRVFLWEGSLFSIRGVKVAVASSALEHFEAVWPERSRDNRQGKLGGTLQALASKIPSQRSDKLSADACSTQGGHKAPPNDTTF